MAKPTLRDRVAPHLFVFSGTLILTCLVMAFVLPKVTGDTVLRADLESGEPVPFHATGERNLHFYMGYTFGDFIGPGQNATLVVVNANNETVFEANASVGSIGQNKDERALTLIPTIPDWRPSAPGEYRAIYTYINGTDARETLVIVEGGWFLRDPLGELFYATLIPIGLLLFVTVFLARPENPEGEGLARFYPVRGATLGSLIASAGVGLAAAALLLWMSGGGLTGF